jgi:hypothetical protein
MADALSRIRTQVGELFEEDRVARQIRKEREEFDEVDIYTFNSNEVTSQPLRSNWIKNTNDNCQNHTIQIYISVPFGGFSINTSRNMNSRFLNFWGDRTRHINC